MNATGLIIGDKVIPCTQPVFNWNDHGMKFERGKGTRDRKEPIRTIVVHWTGGEGNGEKIFKVLQQRKLGIDFHIDPKGKICQFNEPTKLVAFGQGIANNYSIGIEISNYAFGNVLDSKRKVREQILKDRKVKVADFYDEQMIALHALVDSLCTALNIPKQVPTKNGIFHSNAFDTSKFTGIVGHINLLQTTKIDPGNQPFEYLISKGYSKFEI